MIALLDGPTVVHLVRALELYRRRLRGDGVQLPAELRSLFEAISSDSRGQGGPETAWEGPSVQDLAVVPQLLTYEEVADRCRVSERTVKRFVTTGQLQVVKLGSASRVHVDDLRSFIDSLREERRRQSPDGQAQPRTAQRSGPAT